MSIDAPVVSMFAAASSVMLSRCIPLLMEISGITSSMQLEMCVFESSLHLPCETEETNCRLEIMIMHVVWYDNLVQRFEVGSRMYAPAESGEAEMCDMYCKRLGRGHHHLVVCQAGCRHDCTISDTFPDGARHESRQYHPHPG